MRRDSHTPYALQSAPRPRRPLPPFRRTGASCRGVARTMGGHPLRERLRVARLDEDGAGPGELADEALGGRHVGDDAARRDALENVLAVPSDQVAVVDNVPLALLQLERAGVSCQHYSSSLSLSLSTSMLVREGVLLFATHVFSDDCAQARYPQQPDAADLEHV